MSHYNKLSNLKGVIGTPEFVAMLGKNAGDLGVTEDLRLVCEVGTVL